MRVRIAEGSRDNPTPAIFVHSAAQRMRRGTEVKQLPYSRSFEMDVGGF